jgi:hypothetical protein
LCDRNLATREGRSKRKPRMELRGFRKVAWRERTTSLAASPACRVSTRNWQPAEELPVAQAREQVRFSALGETAAAMRAQAPASGAPAPCELAERRVRVHGNAATPRCAAPSVLGRAALGDCSSVARRCLTRRVSAELAATGPDAGRHLRCLPAPYASARQANPRACSRRVDSPCPECSDALALLQPLIPRHAADGGSDLSTTSRR